MVCVRRLELHARLAYEFPKCNPVSERNALMPNDCSYLRSMLSNSLVASVVRFGLHPIFDIHVSKYLLRLAVVRVRFHGLRTNFRFLFVCMHKYAFDEKEKNWSAGRARRLGERENVLDSRR